MRNNFPADLKPLRQFFWRIWEKTRIIPFFAHSGRLKTSAKPTKFFFWLLKNIFQMLFAFVVLFYTSLSKWIFGYGRSSLHITNITLIITILLLSNDAIGRLKTIRAIFSCTVICRTYRPVHGFSMFLTLCLCSTRCLWTHYKIALHKMSVTSFLINIKVHT